MCSYFDEYEKDKILLLNKDVSLFVNSCRSQVVL